MALDRNPTRNWPRHGRSVDFAAAHRAALRVLPSLLRDWLPGGRIVGHEFVARNPTRADRKAGSFKINLRSGRWADFATGDRGGDIVSLVAYLRGTSQVDAARFLAGLVGEGA